VFKIEIKNCYFVLIEKKSNHPGQFHHGVLIPTLIIKELVHEATVTNVPYPVEVVHCILG